MPGLFRTSLRVDGVEFVTGSLRDLLFAIFSDWSSSVEGGVDVMRRGHIVLWFCDCLVGKVTEDRNAAEYENDILRNREMRLVADGIKVE